MSGKPSNGPAPSTAAAPVVVRPELLRNVALVGPSGAGKTLLLEALLAAAGAITRKGTIEDGTTVGDSDPSSVKQGRSVGLAVAPVMVGEVKVNLVDTPGYADFIGEVRAGLRAADGALFVVSAVDGVDPASTALWAECEHLGMPRAVVITRLDHPRADYAGTLAACRTAFGESVLPLHVPLDGGRAPQAGGAPRDGSAVGLLSLLTGTVAEYPGTAEAAGAGAADAGVPGSRPASPAEAAAWEAARGELLEGIIAESEDETLMERYLGGEEIGLDTVIADLETAVARGSFHPVVPASAVTGLGTAEILEVLSRGFPSPPERPAVPATDLEGRPVKPLACDPAGPLAGEVVRTTVDPFLGRVCLVRMFSGTLREDTAVHVGRHGLADRGHADHDSDERVGRLYSPLGSALRAVPSAVAGDLCVLAKLAAAETGDTVSAREAPLLIAPWDMPEPLLPVAVEAATHGDEDALARSLAKVAAGDPTLRLERNAETHQLVLWCMGEAHAEVVLDRLRGQGVGVRTVDVVTPLRETFAAPAAGHGRHVKQSGGHGQFAICDIEVEPLPRGGGFEFTDRVVGGAIPKAYIESVEKGVRAQMAKGLAEGFPVVDLRVTVVGGKTHSVDSSDAAFQAAGALALREAAAAGRIQLLEPVSLVTITVPEAQVGAVMSDLSARRGRLTGTTTTGGQGADSPVSGVVTAEVPDAELVRYAVDLRSLTGGAGQFRREYLRHEPVPHHG
ncbi:elongation factor G-like protein EF-G2 [Sinomonas halotolerans]|uniref:Elongation factor G-like protein EF-G2 n=1 Tax=Sinomonas halotolerans TaxID=1644133 RepID=A0ABU9WZG1_9MICC